MKVKLFETAILFTLAFAASGLLPTSLCAYPLSFEQRTRLKTYLPNTLPKLDGKDPVNVVLIGGGNMYGVSNLQEERLSGDALTSFAGVFLEKLATEFFYTGGVRLVNPPPGGRNKREQPEAKGYEIWMENLAVPYGSVFSGLQRVKSDVFLHKPDIVIIQYGATDALNNCSTFAYRWALDLIVAECKKAKVDVILVGPCPVNRGGGALKWGITRPYASAARGIAASHSVAFFDPGQTLIGWGGAADGEASAKAGSALIGDRLQRIFFVPKGRRNEIQHINKRAHADVGRQMFHELLNGQVRSSFGAAGRAVMGVDGSIEVAVSLQNQTDQQKDGIIGAMALGAITPRNASQRFSIPPHGKQVVSFTYVRPVIGKSESGADIYCPLEIYDEFGIRFPFLVEDGDKAEFLDLPPLLCEPVNVNWKTQQIGDFVDQFRVDWEIKNGSSKAINGNYKIGFGDVISPARAFSLTPLGTQSFAENFSFSPPTNSHCFQREIFLEVTVAGKTYRFSREMEATRDLVLGEKIRMVSGAYANAPASLHVGGQNSNWAPSVYFNAQVDKSNSEKSGLFCSVDLTGVDMPRVQNGYALRATLSLDARQAGKVKGFGGVSPLVLYFKNQGSKGTLNGIPIGAFGDGYNKKLHSRGVKSVLKNNQLDIKIPKTYLDKLGWNFTKDSIAGVSLEIAFADPDSPGNAFPTNRSFFTNYPGINYQGQLVRGMAPGDPRGLCTLRFTRTPVSSWYARLY